MKYLILGAAGFIGKNLIKTLLKDTDRELVLFDRPGADYSAVLSPSESADCKIIPGSFDMKTDFEMLTEGVDIVYHLISTTIPGNLDSHMAAGIVDNVAVTALLLDACVKNKVQKIIFMSSGGTVYGLAKELPYKEETDTYPISAYGMQKISIEKLLYLYNYIYGLDYRIIRLSNPYGTYQNPNGIQGVVTTFAYRALHREVLQVYGDGSVVRDFIYIDDAIKAMQNIAAYRGEHKVFNVGAGKGFSINQVIDTIKSVLDTELEVCYTQCRKTDVPVNILDISRYEKCFGELNAVALEQGIRNTLDYLENIYDIKTAI